MPSFGGSPFNQSKPTHQTFGAQNRFMNQTTEQNQPQQNPVFNPNDVSFGGGMGFTQPATSGLKSFSNFGSNQTGSLFGQGQNQPQTASNPFAQFANPATTGQISNPLAQNNPPPMFGNSVQGGMFGNQQSAEGLFGGMNQPNQGANNNLLSSFNPTGMTTPANPQANSAYFKTRK